MVITTPEEKRSDPPATTSMAYLPCCDVWEDVSNSDPPSCGTCGKGLADDDVWGDGNPDVAVYGLDFISRGDGSIMFNESVVGKDVWQLERKTYYKATCIKCGRRNGVGKSSMFNTLNQAIHTAEVNGWKDGLCPDCQDEN